MKASSQFCSQSDCTPSSSSGRMSRTCRLVTQPAAWASSHLDEKMDGPLMPKLIPLKFFPWSNLSYGHQAVQRTRWTRFKYPKPRLLAVPSLIQPAIRPNKVAPTSASSLTVPPPIQAVKLPSSKPSYPHRTKRSMTPCCTCLAVSSPVIHNPGRKPVSQTPTLTETAPRPFSSYRAHHGSIDRGWGDRCRCCCVGRRCRIRHCRCRYSRHRRRSVACGGLRRSYGCCLY